MFKSVEYIGFDDHPELKALAERAAAAVANVVGTWAASVEVDWEAYPDNPSGAELTLTLVLPTGEGAGSRFLPADDLATPSVLEDRCRSVWLKALDAYFDRRKTAWDEIIRQPAEV